MMKTKTSKRLFSLLLACTMALSVFAMTVFASAEASKEKMSNVRSSGGTPVSAMNTTSSIQAPNRTVSYYNTAVSYQWTPSTSNLQVAMTDNSLYYYIMGNTYKENSVVYEIGSRRCDPDYYAAKAYNSATNYYSSATNSLEHIVNGVTRYGYDSKYAAVVRIPYWMYDPEDKVPTKYDQTDFVWTHGLGSGDKLYATIEYNGVVADLNLTIPWIGYDTADITIDGVTFYFRTGPNKCSIKASSNVSVIDIRFAYGEYNAPA